MSVAGRFVGQSVLRREDPRLLTGHGRYVANLGVPGMAHVAFVRSSVARGLLTRIDVAAARAVPGVHAVLTAADLAGEVPGPLTPTLYLGAPGAPVRLLARGDVRYVGEPIALVVACDPYVAADAAELVEIAYETQPAVVDIETAAASTELVNPERNSNVAGSARHDDPAAAEAIGAADHVVTATFHQQRQANAPMETRGVLASWDPGAGQLDVWLSSQNPHEARRVLARALGLAEADVRVRQGDVGGGFGQKFLLLTEEIAVAAAAKALGRPLKWVEDRHENLVSATHARADRVTATLALDADGTMLAVGVDHLEDVGALPIGGSGGAGTVVASRFTGPYRIPHASWATTAVHTNTCRRGAYRGPWMMETTAREQLVDVAAAAIGMDPLELRRRNVIRAEDQPHPTPGGAVIEDATPAETLEQAAAMIDYPGFRAEQAAARAGGRYFGIGISLFVEPQGSIAAIRQEAAMVRLLPDGTVTVAVGSGNHGQGLETTMAQVVADHLGVDVDHVRVHDGDTASTPFGNGTGGSRSGPVLAPAVGRAAGALRDRVLAIAGHHLEAAPEDLEVAAGRVSVRGTPSRGVTLAEVAHLATAGIAALPPDVDTTLEVTTRYRLDRPVHSNACHMCTCEVDVETGMVRLLRYVVSEDCGTVINPMVVEGQIAGGVAQGIGGALYEHMAYDGDGNPLTASFLDYTMPGTTDVPGIEYGHVETPSAALGGYKGMGEGGAIGAPACVLNAVADALAPLGVARPQPPVTPAAVFALLRDRLGH
ncbi:MAG TPA: xanthine dehydrogenase family protein molybdopterin-binding subunit [Acidimicrobiales bacterium]|nr:xanthine dehydrogenase family protein molybdopterin-binding subunit [Acidimicrobiales bacterium]